MFLIVTSAGAIAQQTPEVALQSFVAALNKNDLDGAAKLVSGGVVPSFIKGSLLANPPLLLTVDGVAATVAGDYAFVTFDLTMRAGPNGPAVTQKSYQVLVRDGSDWLIDGPEYKGRLALMVNILAMESQDRRSGTAAAQGPLVTRFPNIGQQGGRPSMVVRRCVLPSYHVQEQRHSALSAPAVHAIASEIGLKSTSDKGVPAPKVRPTNAPQLAGAAPKATDQITLACLHNAKALTLAVLMFVADHHEVFSLTSLNWQRQIMPYVGKPTSFSCPFDDSKGDSYSFNDGIAGRGLYDLIRGSVTVVLYEGQQGRLNFRHNGRAAVGFADGHSEMVNPLQAKNLAWRL